MTVRLHCVMGGCLAIGDPPTGCGVSFGFHLKNTQHGIAAYPKTYLDPETHLTIGKSPAIISVAIGPFLGGPGWFPSLCRPPPK